MKVRLLSKSILASSVLVLTLSAHTVQAEGNKCTDYNAIENAPQFTPPSRSEFNYFWNDWLTQEKPYHMAHDQITLENRPITITGKFDYGAVIHKDLEYEYVSAYLSGTDIDNWQPLGRYKTNKDGKIFVNVPALKEGQYQVKMVVLGDLSETSAYVTVVKAGTKAVVFDIDETLTVSNLEQIKDYTQIEAAEARGGAHELVSYYVDQGYHPIFVTGRSYWYAKGSRNWLKNQLNVPDFTLRTTSSNRTGLFNTANYKTNALLEFQKQGIEIIRAYGNATTDIEAYDNAGISKTDTYIVGKNAGQSNTQAIQGENYWQHLESIVYTTPHSGCL